MRACAQVPGAAAMVADHQDVGSREFGSQASNATAKSRESLSSLDTYLAFGQSKKPNNFLERAKTQALRTEKYGSRPEPIRGNSKVAKAMDQVRSLETPKQAVGKASQLVANIVGEFLKPSQLFQSAVAKDSELRDRPASLKKSRTTSEDSWQMPGSAIKPSVKGLSVLPSSSSVAPAPEPPGTSDVIGIDNTNPEATAMRSGTSSQESQKFLEIREQSSNRQSPDAPRKKISDMVRSGSMSSMSQVLHEKYRKTGSKSRMSLGGLEDIEQDSRLRVIVDSTWFSTIAILIVILHSVFLAIDTNYDLGTGTGSASFAGDCTFTAIYMLELAIRLQAYRRDFFSNGWNVLDLALVGLAVTDLIVVVAAVSSDSSLSVMAVFRMMRLIRLARLVRLFRFFKSLWLLVCGLAASMRTVFWAWLLIYLIIYIFGLCFTRIFAPYTCELSDDSNEELQDLDKYFGNVGRAMFSVFQTVTLEDWTLLAKNAAVYEPWTRVLFFAILGVCTWGVMHVITAVFVESSLEASSVRSADVAKKAKEEYQESCKYLCEVFLKMNKANDDSLSKQEYIHACDEPEVREKLKAVGIDRSDALELFDILDINGTKRLSNAEFVEGILRSCGPAQNKDLISMRCDVWRVEVRLQDEFDRACNFIQERVQESMGRVEALQEEAAPLLRQAKASLQQSNARHGDSQGASEENAASSMTHRCAQRSAEDAHAATDTLVRDAAAPAPLDSSMQHESLQSVVRPLPHELSNVALPPATEAPLLMEDLADALPVAQALTLE